jgi:hypothetical protein
MKKVNSIPSVLAVLSVAYGCAPMEEILSSSDDIADCEMESAIGSHIKEEECDPKNGPGRNPNGVFDDITAEQIDRTSGLPEGKCGNE